jgi:alpha-mannosidase
MHRHVVAVLVLTLMLTATASAQVQTIFQIGQFDESSAELGEQATTPSVFIVQSSRAKDWPASERAVLQSKLAEAATLKIQFDLPDVPRGAYRLRIGLIVKTPRLPLLQIGVNGHQGWFYQRPEVDYREGNAEATIFPQYSTGTLTAEIPAAFLGRGRNEISLVAVTDPLTVSLPGGEANADAALNFDALALDNIPDARPTNEQVSAAATPTVFYKRERGRLAEVVSVTTRWQGLTPRGSVTLSIAGWSDTQTFASEREFGEQRLEFLVPEFAAETRAKIKITVNGRDYSGEQVLRPAKKWTVYLVPHEHLDVGYSDFQTKLAELHSRVIDDAMDLASEQPGFCFSLDGYWQAQQFLEGRSEAERQRFFDAIRDRKIFVPAQHSVMLTGFPTAETLLRSFYGSYKLNRAHGGPWNYANITDVPSYSWSYASILSASGLKYFSAAANADRGPTLMLGDLHLKSPFWWEGPDGSRVLVWYARHYHQIGSEFGFPPVIATGYEALPSLLHVYDRPDYAASAVLLHGSQWENTSLYAQQASLVKDWNALFAYPELKFAGFGEALENIAAGMGDKIRVVRGDGGPYWEDGVASDARLAALERENERRAVSGEKLSTIASLVDPRFKPSSATLASMWDDILLMNEHTWGWGRSVTEPHSEDSVKELSYKRLRAARAHDNVESLMDRAMTAIAGQVETPQRALVVFNTLNWKRDGWVEFDLQKTRELVDVGSGRVVEFDVLGDEPAYQRIRFLAHDIPAMGYRTYEVRDKVAGAAQTGSARADQANLAQPFSQNPTVENSYYRVTLDPQSGAIRSIYDKELKRELVNTSSPYRFGQYVYVTGGDRFPNQLLTFRRSSPIPHLETHLAGEGRFLSVSRTPTGLVARLESHGLNTPQISTEVALFDGEKKIEINNRVRKDEVSQKEGVYFAFPLAIREPQFNYEIQSGVVNPAKDMMPGAGLEWFSSQNWISVSEPGVAISLVNKDSFLWTFGDIVRGTWPKEFGRREGTIFSYVMNNYWNTNYVAAQGGEFTFRYVLTSTSAPDWAALSRFGWAETTPLERVLIKSQDQTFPARHTLAAATASFLEIDNPSVLLSTWKQAEEDGGSILRFIELGGRTESVLVSSPLFGNAAAQVCGAMEDCGPALSRGAKGLSLSLKPRQIFTMKVRTGESGK